MNLFFNNHITLENKEELQHYLSCYPHETSGLTFTSLYMWRSANYFSYDIIDDFLVVAGQSNFEGFEDDTFIFPLLPLNGTCNATKMKSAMEKILARFKEKGQPFVMRLIPPHMQESYRQIMPGKFIFLNDRDNHDYVYRVEDLANLSGRRYHGKKNHVNRFDKELEGRFEIVPMSADLKDEALALLQYIDDKKQVTGFELDMLHMEADALRDALPSYDELGFEGIALMIDGRLQGYAFGGRLDDTTIVEHVEKGNIDFPGIYQKVNQAFCQSVLGRYEFVNREEDMGLEGLRKAKTSYKPCRMIEKSIAMLADDKEAIARYSFEEK